MEEKVPRRGVRGKRKCPGEGLEGRESAQERGWKEEKVPRRRVIGKRKYPVEGLEGRESAQERG